MISPTLPPVIIKDAITSVYSVIAVWIPVTSVPTSLATVAIAVFITVISSAMTNCAAANVSSTTPEALAATEDAVGAVVTTTIPLARSPGLHRPRCAEFAPAWNGARTGGRPPTLA